jgi:F-box and WD-40 domain protein CDC4
MDPQEPHSSIPLGRPLSPRPSRPMVIDPSQLVSRPYHATTSPIDQENEYNFPPTQTLPMDVVRSKSRNGLSQSRPKRLSTTSKSGIPLNTLPSAPASPPTPAPSPTPYQRAPSWTCAGENEDSFLRGARGHFSNLNAGERERYLAELLNMCDSQLLSFVHHFVSPRLKKDPFEHLPDELCLRVCMF